MMMMMILPRRPSYDPFGNLYGYSSVPLVKQWSHQRTVFRGITIPTTAVAIASVAIMTTNTDTDIFGIVFWRKDRQQQVHHQ